MHPWRRLAALGPPCLLLVLGLGCRAMETQEELQDLAGEASAEPAAEAASPAPSGGTVADDGLEEFPFPGSAFPGLGGRLHSSLCDPASDPYSTCI